MVHKGIITFPLSSRSFQTGERRKLMWAKMLCILRLIFLEKHSTWIVHLNFFVSGEYYMTFLLTRKEINLRLLEGKKSGELFLSLQGVGERIQCTLHGKFRV